MLRRALLVALLFLLTACVPKRSSSGLERVRAAGVLEWGGDIQGGEPYVYGDPEDPSRLVGFEVDLAEALARELGVKAKFVQNDWQNLVPSLERGTFDVAMNGLEVTDSRIGRVLLTRPYYVFTERLVARADDTSVTSDIASLKGKRVATLENSLAWEMLRGIADIKIYEGVDEPYVDLAQGRVDAVLLDDIIVARYAAGKPGLRVVGDLKDGYYAIAVRPGEQDLYEAIDAALGKIAASGELRAILEKHGLWNDRQNRIASWTQDDQAKMLGRPPPPPPLGWSHVALFGKGAVVTILVSTCAMAIAVPLGLLLSLARLYGGRALAWAASAYVELYRGTPVLLQLYLLYYGLAPIFRFSALAAAIVGLGMNYAAYEAEVYRAGIQAVPKAQMEAALALGMSQPLALRRIVLPQAMRHAIPNVTNDFIALLKDSSLVSVITVVELTKQMTITAVDVRTWLGPGILCAAMYFAMSYPLGIVARRLERKLEGERVVEQEA